MAGNAHGELHSDQRPLSPEELVTKGALGLASGAAGMETCLIRLRPLTHFLISLIFRIRTRFTIKVPGEKQDLVVGSPCAPCHRGRQRRLYSLSKYSLSTDCEAGAAPAAAWDGQEDSTRSHARV